MPSSASSSARLHDSVQRGTTAAAAAGEGRTNLGGGSRRPTTPTQLLSATPQRPANIRRRLRVRLVAPPLRRRRRRRLPLQEGVAGDAAVSWRSAKSQPGLAQYTALGESVAKRTDTLLALVVKAATAATDAYAELGTTNGVDEERQRRLLDLVRMLHEDRFEAEPALVKVKRRLGVQGEYIGGVMAGNAGAGDASGHVEQLKAVEDALNRVVAAYRRCFDVVRKVTNPNPKLEAEAEAEALPKDAFGRWMWLQLRLPVMLRHDDCVGDDGDDLTRRIGHCFRQRRICQKRLAELLRGSARVNCIAAGNTLPPGVVTKTA